MYQTFHYSLFKQNVNFFASQTITVTQFHVCLICNGSGCELVSRCCDSYEYCVACCMDPTRTVMEVALKTKVARQATARTCSSLFEFCSGRCRHNSQSVVHENAYANELHHCFSEQLNPSGESGEPAVETKLTDLTIIAARYVKII
ncbi:hypothetical protein BDL97_10G060800 [Sphagnum fallax]|nr:hypothetical protein BDL97_10G060800 [Sphagnum fallax]